MEKNKRSQILGMLLALACIPASQAATQLFTANSSTHFAAAGGVADDSTASQSTQAINLDSWHELRDIIPHLAQKQVVFVGEVHTRFDHHLNQLAIIRGLFKAHPDLVIGVEYFQQPYQIYLDRFVAGEIDEAELLLKTQYYRRWGYDFRLYAPIFRFVREHKIPVIALNVPAETTERVSEVGISGLTKKQRATLPEHIDTSDADYRKRLVQLYEYHPEVKGADFEKFYEVQLAWDEGMAACAAQYLKQHPGRAMVILTGSGHVAYGTGIPRRLSRRLPLPFAIVLNDWQGAASPGVADYILFSREQDLPPAGMLGVLLSDSDGTGARVESFAANSAARAAGIERGDRIVAVNEGAVDSLSDTKARLWNMKPGEQVLVKVRRSSLLHQDMDLTFSVTLR